MRYFDELDAWLSTVLIITEDDQTEEQWISRGKKQIKERILESYRNGQKAGMKPSKAVPEEPRESKPQSFWQSRKTKQQ